MIWLADVVVTSSTPVPTAVPAASDPWTNGFWTCFWIYTAAVIVVVVVYQIGYHRWNPLRKKKEPLVMYSHLTRNDLPDEWPNGAAR